MAKDTPLRVPTHRVLVSSLKNLPLVFQQADEGLDGGWRAGWAALTADGNMVRAASSETTTTSPSRIASSGYLRGFWIGPGNQTTCILRGVVLQRRPICRLMWLAARHRGDFESETDTEPQTFTNTTGLSTNLFSTRWKR